MGAKPAARASLASLEKRAAPAISPTSLAAVSGPKPGSWGNCGATCATGSAISASSRLIAVSRLRAQGVGVLLEPTDEPWGERNAGVLDPDGYPVYLTQSLEDSWITRSPAQPATRAPNP
jgi:hypothetical protein